VFLNFHLTYFLHDPYPVVGFIQAAADKPWLITPVLVALGAIRIINHMRIEQGYSATREK
jgi:hypothetical protein